MTEWVGARLTPGPSADLRDVKSKLALTPLGSRPAPPRGIGWSKLVRLTVLWLLNGAAGRRSLSQSVDAGQSTPQKQQKRKVMCLRVHTELDVGYSSRGESDRALSVKNGFHVEAVTRERRGKHLRVTVKACLRERPEREETQQPSGL